MFIALGGKFRRWSKFLDAAFARGARAAVVDAAHDLPVTAPLLVVENTHRALIAIASGHRDSIPMQTIAVTGSVGKTTVKEMIADVLASESPTVRTLGNWNNDIGLPLSILTADSSHRFGVFEVGMNHPGELAPLCDLVKPVCSVITPVGPVHLEFFKNERAIADEKATVFRKLQSGGVSILNRDDKWFDVLRAAAPGRTIITSLRGNADYTAKDPRR